MKRHRYLTPMRLILTICIVVSFAAISLHSQPASPTDETKVPHYFGPYPNWANSPFTLPDVQVVITGDGSGAEAVATVGADGAITGVTITNPGHNYSNARVDFISSTGSGATADALNYEHYAKGFDGARTAYR